MAYLLMLHSPATTLATMNHALNVTTSDTSTSTVNDMSVQYAKLTALDILNDAVLWAILVLAPPHHYCPPPLNLVLSLLHVLDEWSQNILVFDVATLAPIPLLVLALL